MNDLVPRNSGSDYALAEPMDNFPESVSGRRLQRYLMFLRRFWWIPVLTLLMGLAAEAAYVHLKDPAFISKSSMWETVRVRLPGGGLFSDNQQNFIGTQSALLRSPTMRNLALARIHVMTNNYRIPVGEDGQPLPVDIDVRGDAKSSVFGISATGSDPRYTQLFLDALMDAYLNYKKTMRRAISGDTLASISEEVQRWERDLKSAEDDLTAFEQTNNLAVIQTEATIAGGYLARLQTQLSDLQLRARLLDALQNNQNDIVTGSTNSTELEANMIAALGSTTRASAASQKAFTDLEMLKMKRARLSKYLRPKHPKIIQLDKDIDQEEKLMAIYRQQDQQQLLASQQANDLKITNVLETITEWRVQVEKANNVIATANTLKRRIRRVENVYDRLVSLVQNVSISRNIEQDNVAILEQATPAKRSYTDEMQGLVLAIFGGLGLGLGIVFLIEWRDDRFLSVSEANTSLGGAVVGLLPEVTPNKNGALPLLEINDPRHLYAESYRSLRSALLFLDAEGHPPRVLLITSAMPNEGKSTVSANLARTMALSGARVLLVDGDLRRGELHQALQMQSGPGLAELLYQTCTPEQAVQANSIPNFFFISRGACSGHPGDLYLRSGLDQLFTRWRQEYDYVIIDSSPLFAADDASALAPKVDGTLLVVRRRYSSARAVREALDSLAQRQARIVGVVFNGADTSTRSYYYYKYSDYYPPAGSEPSDRRHDAA